MDSIIHNHRQEILDIAHQRGVMNVRVFGSMSRNDTGPDSDVITEKALHPKLRGKIIKQAQPL